MPNCNAPDDARVAGAARQAQRQTQRQTDYSEEQSWLTALLHNSEGELLAERGFTRTDVERLITLSQTRHRWLTAKPAYDWSGGLSIAVAGTKPFKQTDVDRFAADHNE